MELLFGRPSETGATHKHRRYEMRCERRLEGDEQLYSIEVQPDMCGKIDYRFRVYPHHPLLAHPYEMGMMLWL